MMSRQLRKAPSHSLELRRQNNNSLDMQRRNDGYMDHLDEYFDAESVDNFSIHSTATAPMTMTMARYPYSKPEAS